MDNNELMHHGILGMKWGVRRYQNKDGSLTPAGKRRVQTGEIGKTADTNVSSTSSHKRSVKEMSDSELRDKISRLELEKRYRDLSKSSEQAKTSKGRAFVMSVLEQSGKNIATQAVTYAMGSMVNKTAKNMGVKNATRVLKNKDGKPIIDENGREVVEEIFADIVNPRKGQKDK